MRRLSIILIGALVFGGWALLLLCLTPRPDLLQKAARTAFSGDAPYQWLSNHELLVFDRAPEHGWNCFRLDTLTGTKVPLPELQRSLSNTSDMPYFLKVSPDGKHVVYHGSATPQLFTTKGTRLQSCQWNTPPDNQNIANGAPFWLANGRLVFLPNLNNATAPLSDNFLRLPFLDARKLDAQISSEDGSAIIVNPQTEIQNLKLLTIPFLPEFGAAQYYSPPMLTASGLLYAYASAYEENDTRVLLLQSLTPGSAAVKHVVHAPPGLTFAACNSADGDSARISPQGNRVFWLFHSRAYTPPLRALLRRFTPGSKRPPISG